MDFKQYEYTENEDGTFDILSVPIFVLGKHRGFKYDEKWYKEVLANHKEDEENDYYPSIILGHNGEDMSDEKPAKGLLKNLQLKGKNILADLTKITKDMFESIKNREYPHRSVEVNPEAHKITALALLGGHAPYHKMPVLEVFHDDDDHEILNFYLNDDDDLEWDNTVNQEAKVQEKRSGLQKIINVITDRLWRIAHSSKEDKEVENKVDEVLDQGRTAVHEHLKVDNNYNKNDNEEVDVEKKFTEDDLEAARLKAAEDASKTAETSYREKFKEENGIYPDEMAGKMKLNAEKAYTEGLTSSVQNLREKKYAEKLVVPAVFDEMVTPILMGIKKGEVKFAEKDDTMTMEKAVVELIDNIFARASENKLFVDTGENVNHDQGNLTKTRFGDEDVDPESAELDKKVQKYSEENKVSYVEALEAVKQAGEAS